ncbi:MAG: OmpA family protein [Desulfuromonadales bacterium]|nr:OmpA family protein [Desulfuromonadales bacterium]
MNRNNRFVCSFALVVLTSVLLASCGPPTKNVDLEKAQASFAAAKMDPVVVKNAALGLQTAETSLQTAESLWKADAKAEEVSHHAYLSLQRTAIAKEIANQKVAEESVEAASSARDRVLLEARTYEADEATKSAELARRRAQEQSTLLAVKTVESQQSAEAALAAEARAKKLEAEVAQLQAIKSERGLVITLGDVLFDTGQAELKGSAMVTISKVANFMRTYPTRTLLVEGFTDSRGSESYNLDLSERRTNSVRSALSASGVDVARIAVRGYGESYSVASNETPVGRQLNRRVEVIISDEEGRIVERR